MSFEFAVRAGRILRKFSVLVETWHDTYDSLIGTEKVAEITSKWHAVEVLARQLEAEDSSFLVAEVDGRIVGHAMVRIAEPAALVLARLYVLPAYQRRSIGAQLLTIAIERHLPAKRVRLDVEAENSKGLSFYRKHDFIVVGETSEDGVKVLQMEKQLG